MNLPGKYCLTVKEFSEIENIPLSSVKRKCKNGQLDCRKVLGNGGEHYRISTFCLSVTGIEKYYGIPEDERQKHAVYDRDSEQIEYEMTIMQGLSGFEREYKNRWFNIIEETRTYSRSELEEYCREHNSSNPKEKLSVSNIYSKRKAFKTIGLTALIPNWGKHRSGHSCISDMLKNRFKSLYLIERGPAADVCRDAVFGFARKFDPDLKKEDFPSTETFMYQLRKDVPQHAIDLRRKGYAYFRQHHEYYIERDWSDVAAGKGYVSDHHKFDVRVINKEGKIVRPWITAWRDIRSGIFVGYQIHEDECCSDHIFYTFATSVERFGLPDFVYLDNGRDYKVYDFTGIKPRTKRNADEFQTKSRALLGELGVDTVFALPYNAQAKPIERDFLNVKNMFCRFLRGYTGGNSSEKPEGLKKLEKTGNLLSLEEFVAIFDKWITSYYHCRKLKSGPLQGLSRIEAFNKYKGVSRTVTRDSLALLMMRTSKDFTITRNGVTDNTLGEPLNYWAEEFHALKGMKVYLRRHLNDYGTAWVFDSETGALICRAGLSTKIKGYAIDNLDKANVKEAGARKRRDYKIAKILSQSEELGDEAITIEDMCSSQDEIALEISKPSIIQATQHDKAVQELNTQESKHIKSHFQGVILENNKRKLFHLNAEREAAFENLAQNS